MMEQRTTKKYPQQPQETGQEAEASLDSQVITGKEDTKVAALAYRLYEERGGEHGHALDDWLEAEQRLVSRGEGRGF